MTKTIMTLLLTFYSIARVVAMVYQLYYEANRLAPGIFILTCICCAMCFVTAFAHYRGKLSGRTLHNVMMLVAVTALANMLMVRFAPINNLTNADLLITGTIFDIVMYLGTLPLAFQDTAHLAGRTPFARLAAKTAPGESAPEGTAQENQQDDKEREEQ